MYTQRTKDGKIKEYDGHFVNGKKDGKGVLKMSDVIIYDGEWKNDKKHGTGVIKLETVSYTHLTLPTKRIV